MEDKSGIGLAMGAAFGLVAGAAFGDAGMGLVFGAAIGLVLGAGIARRNAPDTSPPVHPSPPDSPKP
jgi:hypothetical protein